MVYKNVIILLFAYQQLSAMDQSQKTQSKPINYRSVVPSSISGVPSLQVLAAQKVHEMRRRGQLTEEQLKLFSSIQGSQASSPEEAICNEVLEKDYSQMSRDQAEEYAFDLASGRVARSDSGRVKQKVLAIEIRTKININS